MHAPASCPMNSRHAHELMSITWDGPQPILACVKTDDTYSNTIHSITTEISLCTPHTSRNAAAISTQSRDEPSPAGALGATPLHACKLCGQVHRSPVCKALVHKVFLSWHMDWRCLPRSHRLASVCTAHGTRYKERGTVLQAQGYKPSICTRLGHQGQSFTSVYIHLTSENHPTPGCIPLQAISHIS